MGVDKDNNVKNITKKKKIIIFTCRGGGAHISVAKAIKLYLIDYYDVEIVDFFDDIKWDPIFKLTRGKYSCVDFYNTVIAARTSNGILIGCVNFFTKFALWLARCFRKFAVKLLLGFLQQKKPDMIISVITAFNFALLDASQKLDIPFFIFSIDFDTTTYLNGITFPDYKKFKLFIPFDWSKTRKKVIEANLKSDQIVISGFPIRSDFLEEKDLNLIKNFYKVPPNKKIVFIMIGGVGSDAVYKYAEQLVQINLPLHLIVCAGRNEALLDKLSKINGNSFVSISSIGFTKKIADIMAIADLFITKPGPTSIVESLYMQVPILLDGVSKTLIWECLHKDFVVENGFGKILQNFNDLEYFIKNMIFDKNNNELIKTKMALFEKESFKDNIKKLVQDII